MAQATKPNSPKGRSREIPPGWQDPLRQQQPLISHQWLLRALALTLGVALICAYLTLCLLFYQGRWQLLFHPSAAISATPASVGMRYEEVQFAYTEVGQPQLSGWWIPATPGARYSGLTLLYLHGATGSLSDTLPRLKELHELGIDIFAIDYRGFGKSLPLHPSEQSVYEDASSAVEYLLKTRAPGTHQLDVRSLVLYGEGLGATIAAETAVRHPDVMGLILDSAPAPAMEQIEGDARTRLLPLRLLIKDRFELAPKLQNLRTPKLFLQSQRVSRDAKMSLRMQSLFNGASPPKSLVQSTENTRQSIEPADYLESLRRFLDENTAPQPAHSTSQGATP